MMSVVRARKDIRGAIDMARAPIRDREPPPSKRRAEIVAGYQISVLPVLPGGGRRSFSPVYSLPR